MTRRPLYHEFAWAYDKLVTRPGGPGADRVARAFAERGLDASALVVDAGCGTGDYNIALVRAGFAAIGIDASPDLIEVARAKAEGAGSAARFEVADLRSWTPQEPADGVLCRGVLNDFIDDADRRDALTGLRAMLGPGGLLIADVRPWEETVAHYSREPGTTKRFVTDRGEVTFAHEAALESERRVVRFRERLAMDGREAEAEFAMRCWTADELDARLREAGFDEIEIPAPDDYLTPRRPDRVVAVARAAGLG